VLGEVAPGFGATEETVELTVPEVAKEIVLPVRDP
jgi:hypothetical protein